MGTFKLPDLGEGLAEAEILEWHVRPGERAGVDQPMVSVETAKAVVEVPMPYAGTVTALRAAVGDIVATGAPLIDIDADSGTVVGSMPPTGADDWVEPLCVAGAGKRGALAEDGRVRAVPAARALAKRLGIDLAGIEGSGAGGLVRLDDVLARTESTRGRPPAALDPPPGAVAEPLRGARRAMARTMSQARAEVAQSTVCDDADIDGWSRRGDFTLRLLRALVAACAAEPALNAWYDARNDSRILFERIDLAIAVDTPGGLIVPVLRDIGRKAPGDLRAAVAAQKEAAHAKRTPPEDLRGFTLMLSNFGTLAGRYGIPLVVPPAVAILGAGKVRLDAVVAAGEIVAHLRMPLSLSFDHRCITGGEACRFLAAVIADLEESD